MELEKLCVKVEKNTSDIALIHKDIAEVIPMKIDQVVGNHFEKYKKEKAEIKKFEASKINGNSKWYKNQYLLIGAVVALVHAITKAIEAWTATIGG